MKECSKSIQRRLHHPAFVNTYFSGHGLDIGGKPDPLSLYIPLFAQLRSVRTWDWEDGNAQYLASVQDEQFDFVHSSHCLEHLVNPFEGINNWFRVVKPGGFLIVTVPDEDLYEQGIFPSTFNKDHKWTFTIWKEHSWSEKTINILDLIKGLGSRADLLRLELLSATYWYGLPRYDQTLSSVSECGIEFVVRKRQEREITRGGRLFEGKEQPPREMLLHLNQYKKDLETLKSANINKPPFEDDSVL